MSGRSRLLVALCAAIGAAAAAAAQLAVLEIWRLLMVGLTAAVAPVLALSAAD